MALTNKDLSSVEEDVPSDNNIFTKTFQICERMDSDASVIFTGMQPCTALHQIWLREHFPTVNNFAMFRKAAREHLTCTEAPNLFPRLKIRIK